MYRVLNATLGRSTAAGGITLAVKTATAAAAVAAGTSATATPRLRSMSSEKMSSSQDYIYETLTVTRPSDYVYQVELNRPDKRNAINMDMWGELRTCFDTLSHDGNCRAIVLSGAGPMFCAGIDVGDLMGSGDVLAAGVSDPGRRALAIRRAVPPLQDSFTAMERCNKPVIAAVHSACIGGGVDMTTACDIRYCSSDAYFQVKEVDVGLAADVGTLQRLPKVVGNDSLVRELCYTARKLMADEAQAAGLVSRVLPDRESCLHSAITLATEIAEKSPVAVTGTKVNLNFSRDHPTAVGLDYVALWNSAMLQSTDLTDTAKALASKTKPIYPKL